MADRYWNARGGSHNDGGAFIFNLQKDAAGRMRITCTDKFGKPVLMPGGTESCDFSRELPLTRGRRPRHRRLLTPRFRREDFRNDARAPAAMDL